MVKGTLHLNPLKTKKGRRQVPIPRAVAETVAAHVASHSHDLVFPAPQGGYLQPNKFRARYWNPALKATGLAVDEPLTPHDLRHTAVAPWIANGAEPESGEHLGWARERGVHPRPLRSPLPRPRQGTVAALDEAIQAVSNGSGDDRDKVVGLYWQEPEN